MDIASVTPLRQIYPTTAFQSHVVIRDRLDTAVHPRQAVGPVGPSSGSVVSAGAGQGVVGPDGEVGVPGADEFAEPRFEPDDRTPRLVYKVVDTSTGVTVQQIPTESHLRLRAYAEQVNQQAKSEDAPAPTTSVTA